MVQRETGQVTAWSLFTENMQTIVTQHRQPSDNLSEAAVCTVKTEQNKLTFKKRSKSAPAMKTQYLTVFTLWGQRGIS